MRARRLLSIFWFLYMGGLGIFFPFYSLYLRENLGLSGSQVGAVLAMLPLVGIAAQPFWGQVADRTGSRSRVLTLIALGAAAGYFSLQFADGFLGILAVTALCATFATAGIPMAVSVSLAVLWEKGPQAFGSVRVWGTVGFLVCVVAFPALLDALEGRGESVAGAGGISEPALAWMFTATAALVFAAAVASLFLPRDGALAVRAARGDWRELLRHSAFVRIVLFASAGYLCLHGPTTHFAIFVRSRGGDLDDVSRMWVLMLLIEIPLIALSGATLTRLGARSLVRLGVLAGGLRWLLSGLVVDPRILYPVQMLHGVAVAGLVIGAPLYVDLVVPDRLRATGQGILAMLGVSVGGIASNLLTGWLIEHVGTNAPYIAGGIGGLLLAALVPFILPRPENTRRSDAPPARGRSAQ